MLQKPEYITPEQFLKDVDDLRIRFPVAAISKGTGYDKIFYKMNKGEKFKELEIHPKLKLIIDKYINAQTLYLFPVVTQIHNDWNKKEIIGRANALIRNFLIYAAQQAGIEHHVHFHMSRHSAGYLALCAGVSMEIIKDAYGHSTYKVTEGYLKSLSDDIVNKEFNKIYE